MEGLIVPSFYYNKDFSTAVSAGLYWSVSRVGYSGYNPDLSADIESTLSPLGLGIIPTPDDNGEILKVRSTNAADVGQTIILEVLDENGFSKTCVSTLNGTTQVPIIDTSTGLEVTISRINSVANRTSPASATLGDVFVEEDGGTTKYSGFKAIDQRSHNLLFTIPVDKKGILLPAESTLNRSAGSDSAVTVRTKTRLRGQPWLVSGRWGLQQHGTSAFVFDTADRPLLPPLLDVMITGTSTANNTDISGRVPIQLIDVNIGT